jgi:hypothetical protein
MAKHNNNVLRMPARQYRPATSDKVFFVGFCVDRGFHPLAWLFRLVSNTKFSKIYVRFKDTKNKQGKVFYKDGMSVNYFFEKNFDKNFKIVKEFAVQVNAQFHDDFLNECFKHANVEYNLFNKLFKPKTWFNVLEWLGFAIELTTPNWSKKKLNKITSKDIYNHFK